MKKILILAFLAFFALAGTGTDAVAQAEKQGPPSWAPAHGFRAKTRHIYFPEHNVYYDNQKGVYISVDGGKWSVSARLPLPLSGIDLQASTKVELGFTGDDPQQFNDRHLKKYKDKPRKEKKGKPGKKK